MERSGSCSGGGNSSVSVGQQVQVGGTGQVIQQRQSHHRIEGNALNETGVKGPTVAIPVQVQVDVYNFRWMFIMLLTAYSNASVQSISRV